MHMVYTQGRERTCETTPTVHVCMNNGVGNTAVLGMQRSTGMATRTVHYEISYCGTGIIVSTIQGKNELRSSSFLGRNGLRGIRGLTAEAAAALPSHHQDSKDAKYTRQ